MAAQREKGDLGTVINLVLIVFADIGLSKITKGESIEGKEADTRPIQEKFSIRIWLWEEDRGGASKKP